MLFWPLSFTVLGANSAANKLLIFFLIFPRKQDLTFHANCRHWISFIFFLILLKTLEAPYWGFLMSTHNIHFCGELRKIQCIMWLPHLVWGFVWIFIIFKVTTCQKLWSFLVFGRGHVKRPHSDPNYRSCGLSSESCWRQNATPICTALN